MLEILKYPNDLLKKICEPVTNFDQELEDLIVQLMETCSHHNGLGLAAPQVGILKQIFIARPNIKKDFEIYINPIFTKASKNLVKSYESCLSIPGFIREVERHKKVKIKFQNMQGNILWREGEGLLATVLQHEENHLRGILIND